MFVCDFSDDCGDSYWNNNKCVVYDYSTIFNFFLNVICVHEYLYRSYSSPYTVTTKTATFKTKLIPLCSQYHTIDSSSGSFRPRFMSLSATQYKLKTYYWRILFIGEYH